MGGIENQQRGLGQTWSKIKTAASTLKEKVGEPCITTSQHCVLHILNNNWCGFSFLYLLQRTFWVCFLGDFFHLWMIHIKWANSFWVY